jgi:hypothetical protein
MTSERNTVLKAETIVINKETADLQKMIDESNEIARLGVVPKKLLDEIDKEAQRLNPSGKQDEEESWFKRFRRKGK